MASIEAHSSAPITVPSKPTTPPQVASKQYVDDTLGGKVNKTGDTMQGPLYSDGSQVTQGNQIVDKNYVDSLVTTPGVIHAVDVQSDPTGNVAATNVQTAIQELDTEKLNVSGGSMTGALYLNQDPTLDLQAATKQYVDSRIVAASSDSFTWNQNDASTLWDITHPLNRYPSVVVVLSTGVTGNAEIEYIDSGHLKIKFIGAESGKAHLT